MNKKGFTLIELMIVFAIMGILAAIVIPKLAKYRDSVKDKNISKTLGKIKASINLQIGDGITQVKDGDKIVLNSEDTVVCIDISTIEKNCNFAMANSGGDLYYMETYCIKEMQDWKCTPK